MKNKRGNKKAALELSVGTIVILVLAMTMLILGIVLVKSIFTGAKYNVDTINDKIKDEIRKLFVEDRKMVVYLANQKAEIKQGEDWGIAWAVKNLQTGTNTESKLSYEVLLEETQEGCGISGQEALSWIVAGKKGDNIPLPPGQEVYRIVRINIPETAPLCFVTYRVETKLDGRNYYSEFFTVEIKA